MPARPRKQIIRRDEVGYYHCYNRCVRRAFLCGVDPLTGHNYEHRKEWIRQRLMELAAAFAVEVSGFSAMDNHLHVVLRNRPDLVRGLVGRGSHSPLVATVSLAARSARRTCRTPGRRTESLALGSAENEPVARASV